MRHNLIFVGNYMIGLRNVRLYGEPMDNGGYFTAAPSDDGPSKVVVGLGQEHWYKVVEVLLHEAMEFALVDMCARFQPTPDFTQSHDEYVFHCDHPQFSEATARVGYFVTHAIGPMKKAFVKYKERAKAEEKAKKAKEKAKAKKKKGRKNVHTNVQH